MTFKAPADTSFNQTGDGAQFGYATTDSGKDVSIRDAQRRFAEADPTKLHGYIIVVCQDIEGDPDRIETLVDFGGTVSIKKRMARGILRAIEQDLAATAAKEQA